MSVFVKPKELPNTHIPTISVQKPPMTFIMGARCTDGVVLVADKKVTLSDCSKSEYQEKLFDGLGHVIYGSSGSTGLYQLFVGHVNDYVNTHRGELTYENAIFKLSEIAFTIFKRYDFNLNYYYDLLVAIAPPNERSHLTFISGYGMPTPIPRCYSIGSGSPYATVFLNKLYNQDMTMTQAAELGYFIIKYIENFELDMTVGVKDGYPQIWFIPDEERNENNEKIDYQITPDNANTEKGFIIYNPT